MAKPITLILIMSLGRSGSTFFARELCKHANFVNLGENRPFWESLKNNKTNKFREFEKIVSQNTKNKKQKVVIDKTPGTFNFINEINYLSKYYDIKLIYLIREKSEIISSRKNLKKSFYTKERILLRIKNYYSKYGLSLFLILIKEFFSFIINPFSYFDNRIATIQNSNIDEEVKIFKQSYDDLKNIYHTEKISYNNFHHDVTRLKSFGLSKPQILRIKNSFNRN
jgi:hypothetical protein